MSGPNIVGLIFVVLALAAFGLLLWDLIEGED